MKQPISRQQVQKLLGQKIYAVKKDGARVSGKLVQIKGNRLYVQSGKGKVKTKAIIPLVLFDLLAIGTAPYAYGGYGPYGYSPYGFGGYGPYGGGFGYPGFF
ncbi:hypothetical protein [Paenibacillus senegalensis]|uniref:hypothetical protein n=1 Tax=Paenibacillus senegalensis TaxID=1465766 RepID=UPI0002890FC4|nr:hypothetical protein [Paenibacillus senegalensis]